MALIDKNIVITPNRGQTADPKIAFTAGSAATSSTITMSVNTNTSGTLTIDGGVGQLFSVVNTSTGTIFAVSDISGIPSVEVMDTGQIKLAQYSGYVSVLGGANSSNTTTGVFRVTGGAGIGGNLYLGGQGYSPQFNSTSDGRLKTNVTTLTNAVETVKQLRGVRFTWIENGVASIGLIAQEVEPIVPEVVVTGEENKYVSYSNLVGLLIEAIKEQQQQIDQLQARLDQIQ